MELEMQKLKWECERNTLEHVLKSSTPHSRISFEGISRVHSDDSALILADTMKSLLESSRSQQQDIVDNLHVPKIDIMKFNGDPLKYCPFMSSFDHAVANKVIDNGTKLNTLIQSCTAEVSSLLQCCLVKDPADG